MHRSCGPVIDDLALHLHQRWLAVALHDDVRVPEHPVVVEDALNCPANLSARLRVRPCIHFPHPLDRLDLVFGVLSFTELLTVHRDGWLGSLFLQAGMGTLPSAGLGRPPARVTLSTTTWVLSLANQGT